MRMKKDTIFFWQELIVLAAILDSVYGAKSIRLWNTDIRDMDNKQTTSNYLNQWWPNFMMISIEQEAIFSQLVYGMYFLCDQAKQGYLDMSGSNVKTGKWPTFCRQFF